MRHGRLFSRPNCPEISHMCLLFVPKVRKQIALKWLFEVPCVCSVGTCGTFLAYLANSSSDIHSSHWPHVCPIYPACALSSVLEKQSEENALKNSTLPWSGACVPLPGSGRWTYPPPLILTLPSPLNPHTHTDPAHLIFSPLLMSNSCRVDSQGIAAITSSSPSLSAVFFSAVLCVAPKCRVSQEPKRDVWTKYPLRVLFTILASDMMSWIYTIGRPWAEMDGQLAINCAYGSCLTPMFRSRLISLTCKGGP